MPNGDDRLLIIAAHPDDEVLGCGGTIARFADLGVEVRIVFLAEGVTARFDPPEFETDEVQAAIRRRNENAFKAGALLGVDRQSIFLNQRHCCRLDQVPQIDLVKEIESHIRDFGPTVLMTHAAADTNVDHGVVHRAVLTATRPLGLPRLRTILAFEVLSSTEWNPTAPFPATAFYDIEGTIDRKIGALRAYGDEMREPPHPRSEHAIRGLAAFRGAQGGFVYAEGFSLIRSVHA